MAEAGRLKLHEEFCELLGSRYAYFQPPETLKMNYPCIRYNGDGYYTDTADNRNYKITRRYEGVVIDPDPDSNIPELLLNHFEMIGFSGDYVADNLNHFPFILYY